MGLSVRSRALKPTSDFGPRRAITDHWQVQSKAKASRFEAYGLHSSSMSRSRPSAVPVVRLPSDIQYLEMKTESDLSHHEYFHDQRLCIASVAMNR